MIISIFWQTYYYLFQYNEANKQLCFLMLQDLKFKKNPNRVLIVSPALVIGFLWQRYSL